MNRIGCPSKVSIVFQHDLGTGFFAFPKTHFVGLRSRTFEDLGADFMQEMDRHVLCCWIAVQFVQPVWFG